MRLLLNMLIILVFVAGCQKNNESTKKPTVEQDLSMVHTILKDKTDNFTKLNETSFEKRDLKKIYKALDNVTGSIKDLENFKKASKDKELYTALKTLVELDIMTLLSDSEVEIKDIINPMNNMVRMRIAPLRNLTNAGVDIRQYLKDYKKLGCIGMNCSYIDELIYLGNLASPLENIKLSKEDRAIMDNLSRSINDAWGLYLFYSESEDRNIYHSLEKKYLPYLKSKKIYNDNIQKLMDDIIKYTLRKSILLIYSGRNFIISYLSDDKYEKDYVKFAGVQDNEIEEAIKIGKEERKKIYPIVCLYPSYLFEDGKKECVSHIENNSFDKIVEIMKDKNVQDNKSYIMTDDEVCMIKDNSTVKFYSNNEICKAIESISKK